MPAWFESEYLLIVIALRQLCQLASFRPDETCAGNQADQHISVSIEDPFGQQNLTVQWPFSDPDG